MYVLIVLRHLVLRARIPVLQVQCDKLLRYIFWGNGLHYFLLSWCHRPRFLAIGHVEVAFGHVALASAVVCQVL